MRVFAIGGEPATGKSSLMKAVIASLTGERKLFQFGLLRGYMYPDAKLFIFGVYDEKVFSGTDRLSMAVQRDAQIFIQNGDQQYSEYLVLFEGDRLFNQKFLDFCRASLGADNVGAVVLAASDPEKERRHLDRKDTQTEQFKKSRRTKYQNILLKSEWVQPVLNQTYEDQAFMLSSIMDGLANLCLPQIRKDN